MLREEDKQILTDTFGIDLEQLKTALTSETEEQITFKSGDFLDEQALTALKETVKKTGYKEGTIAGVEMEAKRVKEKFGIDAEGKSFDTIMSAFQTKTLADAKIEPNKKVNELSDSLSNLQKKYETDLGLKDKEIGSLNNKIGDFSINSDIRKNIPKGLKGVSEDQFLTLAKSSFGFGYEENKLVLKDGDTILKDNMENPIKPIEALTNFATQNGWIDKDGRGGGDSTGGNSSEFKTINDLFKHLETNEIDPNSTEGQKLIDEFNK